MRLIKPLQYSFLLYILFVAACSRPEKPVTKEEAARIGSLLEAAMAQRNTGMFNKLFDAEAFRKRIMEQGNKKLNGEIVKGAVEGLISGELGKQVVQSLGKKGTYQLVKQYEKDNHQHLVFRLYNEKLNYHDFELVKKGEEIKVADMFIYMTGENLSTTLAESISTMSGQMSAIENMDRSEVAKIQRVKQYLNDAEYEKADALFKELPAIIRDQKLYQIIHIQIASGLGNDKYLEALSQFQKEYPDSPNMYLMMIDAYFLKKDYAGTMKSVNQLDSLINKDAFLDYYRALVSKLKEDDTERLMYLERLHKNMPDFSDGTVELISYYLEHKETDKAVELTLQYKKSRNVDETTIDSFRTIYPDYKEKLEKAVG